MSKINSKADDQTNDKDRRISDVAWKLACENRFPEIETILQSCENLISRGTAYRWMPSIKVKYDEFRKIIEEQKKMGMTIGLEASANLADKFTSHDYDVLKDRLYNSTRGRFMEPWEVDLTKIVPESECPIPDPVDEDDPADDPRVQIWKDMNNPHYDPALDPEYEHKRQRISEDISGIDEVLENFEKKRKAELDRISKADGEAGLSHVENLRKHDRPDIPKSQCHFNRTE